MSVVDNVPEKRSLGSRISRIVWDRDEKPEHERKFVQWLDLHLFVIACLGYFIKYLDQANIANAYVSGMQEDLDFTGNQYNTLLSMFTAGYVIGQFPGTLLMVKISPSIWLPFCEILWTVLVMCCSVAKNVETLYALRFFIGMAEATSYPGMIWVLGSWYGPSELGKRAVIFQATSAAGTMFSGYLQAAVHTNLNGVGGLTGWQWLFIMDGVISLPIAFAGLFLIPDIPNKPNPRARWWLRQKHLDIAQERMAQMKRAPPTGFSLQTFKKGFSSWVPWAFFVPYTCFVLGLSSYAYMNLWLKATAPWKTNVTLINIIPTGGYALQIVMALVYSWVSDALNTRYPVIIFGGTVALIGNAILASWPASKNAIFAGFFLNFTVTSTGALMLAWANELTSGNAEGRAITVGFLNTASYVFNAWVPNLLFPSSKAPHYPLGYKVTTAFWAANIVGTALIVLFVRRDKREAHIAEVARENDENGGGVKGIGIIGGDGVSARGDEGSSVEDVKVR
ncbi:MFS general substrate transporter [Stereum hirsutum FP-91666 SS1]|uniref:MFS general substrate transporter n=1 Tax=Stereum hirsutum (strain FP-91666) TaxID=721885 RepID=R7RYI1_STEHR|nr:MFS general substrate transporter [Stereum hirsutum FP-91666 SS1]EIM80384.1 MFS general substrate transporter [Stereum hirsutum FP-91666 SS1]